MQVEIKVPVLPESVTEGTLGDWHKQVGDSVAVEENIVDLETDKVVLEIVASKAGVIESIAYATGDTVKNGDVLAIVNTEAVATAPASEATAEDSASANKASPAVRKLLNENELAADEVQATGKKGAVLKEDVEQHLQQQEPTAKAETPATTTPPAVAIPAGGRNDRRVPMSRLRSKIAERLKQAQNTAALLTTFNEVNLKPMMDARAQYKDAFEKTHGVKLGMMSFFYQCRGRSVEAFSSG